jgi:hypothetical protein
MTGEAVELELELSGRDGEYRVKARSTHGGESESDLRLGFEAVAIERRLERLRLALLRAVVTTRRTPTTEERPVQLLGAELFDHLFVDDVRVLFDLTRQHAAQQDVPMRLVLRIRAPELAVLPWEFLYDARRDDYLSLNMPVVRYPEILEPVRPLRVTGPLRILGMIAQPTGFDALDVHAEREHLYRALRPLVDARRVELGWVEGETWRDLRQALHERSWHVLHFIGHGGFDAVAGEGVFHLPGENGQNYQLRASHLAQLLSPYHSLRLIMLNSCDSAAGSTSDLFSSAAATLVRRGIPAVLAMQFEISDFAAIEFTRSFYGAVALGLPVDIAVRDARMGVCLARPTSLEWGTPVLYLRQRDGRIFDVNPPAPGPRPPAAEAPQAPPSADRPRAAARPPARPPTQPPDPRDVRPRPFRAPSGEAVPRRPPAATRTGSPAAERARPTSTPTRRIRRWTRAHRALTATAGVLLAAGLVLPWVVPAGTDAATVRVWAKAADWTGTNVDLHAGQQVDISATGRATVISGLEVGPDGATGGSQQGARRITTGANFGALIGRIGNGPTFAVGEELHFTSDLDGELFLRVNDQTADDNGGGYAVAVRVP